MMSPSEQLNDNIYERLTQYVGYGYRDTIIIELNKKIRRTIPDLSVCREIEDEVFREITFSEEITKQLENYHGSTNGVEYTPLNKTDGFNLFLIHKNGDKTYHRWLLYNYKTNEIILSKEFHFFKYSYIEFPVSLAIFNERIFISLGVNDDKAFIVETTKESIETCFI